MKTFNYLCAGILSLAFFITGCSNDNDPTEEGKGKIIVSLRSESVQTRLTGTPTDEQTVNTFTIYIFNAVTGVLEHSQPGSTLESTEINNLSTLGSKRVFVIANPPAGLPAITNYNSLTTLRVSLDSQYPGAGFNGLTMTGESAVFTLTPGETQRIPVNIARLVAKVRLGSVTVQPDANHDISELVLSSVTIQRAKSLSAINAGPVETFNPLWGGDNSGNATVSVTQDFLREALNFPTPPYTAGANLNAAGTQYFYVLPNNGADGEETLLSLVGTYAGVYSAYVFPVNADSDNGGDGTFITRNMQYTLNLTLRNIGTGSGDPDEPGGEASVIVEVVPEDWYGELVQTLEW